jgi:hypothetical protein
MWHIGIAGMKHHFMLGIDWTTDNKKHCSSPCKHFLSLATVTNIQLEVCSCSIIERILKQKCSFIVHGGLIALLDCEESNRLKVAGDLLRHFCGQGCGYLGAALLADRAMNSRNPSTEIHVWSLI